MECEKTDNKIECIDCTSFKKPLDIRKMIEKIATMLGIEFKKVDILSEMYLLGDYVIRCEEARFENWTDYCMRCYVEL